MSSGKKIDSTKSKLKWFDVDPETGKLIPLPLNCNNSLKDEKVPSSKKEKRQTTVLQPLCLTTADFEDNAATKERLGNTSHSVRKRKFDYPPKSKTRGTSRLLQRNDKEMFEKGNSNPHPQNLKSQIISSGIKKRRLDIIGHSVRKGLFKSSTQSMGSRRSLTRQSLLSINKKKTPFIKVNNLDSSPLLNMEDSENEIVNTETCLNSCMFQSPASPAFNCDQILESQKKLKKTDTLSVIVEEYECHTPESGSSTGSTNNFLKLEKVCEEGNHKHLIMDSPLSAVCNLLEITNLHSSKKIKNTNDSTLRSTIETIIEMENETFKRYLDIHEQRVSFLLSTLEKERSFIQQITNQHDSTLQKLKTLLNNLEDANSYKENRTVETNRRSVRLLNRTPTPIKSNGLHVPPDSYKKPDLRKSTLKKNLAAKPNETPRTRKALELYNSLRSVNGSILETPKMDRNLTSDTLDSFWTKVQQQCFLLQDTPRH